MEHYHRAGGTLGIAVEQRGEPRRDNMRGPHRLRALRYLKETQLQATLQRRGPNTL